VAAPDNRVFVSTATAWEIAIKHALGRLKFPIERFDDIILRMGFDALPSCQPTPSRRAACLGITTIRLTGC
jgi:PIN domain nuclease of toxin-antitoxin system